MIEDVYPVRIDADAEGPTLITISVGWYDYTPARGQNRSTLRATKPVSWASSSSPPAQWPPAPQTTLANFANQIRLASYAVTRSDNQSISLSLEWVSESPPRRDLTVFARVIDGKGTLLAQKDQPPLAGDYGTSAWEPGEVIRDRIVIPLPVDSSGSGAPASKSDCPIPTTGERLQGARRVRTGDWRFRDTSDACW